MGRLNPGILLKPPQSHHDFQRSAIRGDDSPCNVTAWQQCDSMAAAQGCLNVAVKFEMHVGPLENFHLCETP